MIAMEPIPLPGHTAVGITVDLPGTRLVVATTPAGYLMCGALDVALLDARLPERRVVAARALGVRSLADLLDRPLDQVTQAARRLGLEPGLPGRQALGLLAAAPPWQPRP
jgi:uncharacterized protein YunC (DUF1805 family)